MARREYGDDGGVGRMAGGETKRMRETEKGVKQGVKERKWGCGVESKGGEEEMGRRRVCESREEK